MSECPNCGISDSSWHDAWSKDGPKVRHCRECGTQWQENYPKGAAVPRRSAPAEVLDLPDSVGAWWSEKQGWCVVGADSNSWWVYDGSNVFSGHSLSSALSSARMFSGGWARCLPPLVKPQAKDPDAEWLRMISSRDPDNWASVSIRLARIADEIDDLRRKLEISEAALARLEEAADYFAADQSRATDPRCGLVQPVSVAECEELNQAIMQARSALSAIRAGKQGEA